MIDLIYLSKVIVQQETISAVLFHLNCDSFSKCTITLFQKRNLKVNMKMNSVLETSLPEKSIKLIDKVTKMNTLVEMPKEEEEEERIKCDLNLETEINCELKDHVSLSGKVSFNLYIM